MIRNQKDFYAGLLFVAFGAVALVLSFDYSVGSAARMGPGYFPRLLGVLLVALGSVQTVIGLRSTAIVPVDWHWRLLFTLLLAVALFILLTPWLGLVAASLVMVVVSLATSREFRWVPAVVLGAVLGSAAAALFVYGLGVPLPVWPAFLVDG